MSLPGDHLWTATRATQVAANELTERFRGSNEPEYKQGGELVTSADRAAEEHVIDIINETFPNHNIISEEATPEFVPKPRWVVDSLDGTANFTNGFPHFSVSVAFQAAAAPDIGVVYHVPTNRIYVAIEGEGAYVNGRPAKPSNTDTLSDAFIVTGYDSILDSDLGATYLEALVRSTQAVRRTGSAAAELAMVADGTFDVYVEHRLDVWDVAAGTLIVEEAGGEVMHIEAVDDVTGEIVVASSPQLHSDVVDFLIAEGSLG